MLSNFLMKHAASLLCLHFMYLGPEILTVECLVS